MPASPPPPDLHDDIAAIQRIPVVPLILDVVCRITGMGFAAIARVTEDRWIACSVKDDIGFGLVPGGELAIRTTLCDEIRSSGEPIIIDDVAADATYARHHTPAMYGLQSYISMPIVLPDGAFFGTLCAIDPRPARVSSPEVVGTFRLFAQLIAFHLVAADRLESSEARLEGERANSLLREQFIAVLGHDLRNPLSAIDGGARLLQQVIDEERPRKVLDTIRSSVSRMSAMIDDVLDFARGRLGGGLTLQRDDREPLRPVLEHVVDELRAVMPSRIIHTDFDIAEPVRCDRARLAQLFSNLLGNALTHGDQESPVRVRAESRPGRLTLSVSNSGDPIPPAAMARIFQPFARGDLRPSQQGLGLGLYIAAQIAKAHGGDLAVASAAGETTFTFTMPLD